MSDVDLNPIRAGVATTREESEWTSIQERLLAAARGGAGAEPGLVPFADQAVPGNAPLPLPFGAYVELLRWTAAALADPRGDVELVKKSPTEPGSALRHARAGGSLYGDRAA